MLGALIVTGLMFLYPTIAMYYLCFVSIWLSVQFLQLLILCLLLVVNHFPVFLVFGYYWYPEIFVKSVYFEIIEQQENPHFPTNYLSMRSQKHSLVSLFSDFMKKLKLQVFEFVNISILKHIALGTRIPRTINYDYNI